MINIKNKNIKKFLKKYFIISIFFIKIKLIKKEIKIKIVVKIIKEILNSKLVIIFEISTAFAKKSIVNIFAYSIILSKYKIGNTLKAQAKIQTKNLFLFKLFSSILEKIYPQKTIGINDINVIKIMFSIILFSK